MVLQLCWQVKPGTQEENLQSFLNSLRKTPHYSKIYSKKEEEKTSKQSVFTIQKKLSRYFSTRLDALN